MLKIWGRNNSINVQKVMWCVAELGLEHERIDLGGAFGGNREDWYLTLNPNGLIPMIDDDGFVLWESNAIVRYLAAKYGMGGLCPKPFEQRADADRWMDWQATTLQPQMHPVFWGLMRTAPEARDMAAISAAAARLGETFAILDRHLEGRTYMLGEDLTMADVPLGASTYRWYALDIERPDRPNVRRWYDQLSERHAFRQNVMIPLT